MEIKLDIRGTKISYVNINLYMKIKIKIKTQNF